MATYTTSDPRISGRQGKVGDTIYLVTCGCAVLLVRHGPAPTDWCQVTSPSGPAGPRGETGPSGPPGGIGPAGVQGVAGEIGPAGPMGQTGAQGPVGPQGPQGIPGIDGADGADGAVGPQGPTGATGPQGIQGATGATGPQGPPGADGDDGTTGATGAQGPQGIQGPTGATGPAGPAPSGTGFVRVTDGVLEAPADSIAVAKITGLASVATSGSASDLGAGTLPIARIADADITLAKIQALTAGSILGRASGTGSGVTTQLTAAQVKTILAIANTDVSGLGALATKATIATTDIDADAVTYAKLQNVSATDKLLGRSTAGAGDVEEITCTAAGRALIDDADAAAQRTTLGLAAIAASGSASDLGSGSLPAGRIPNSLITLAMMADLANGKIIGRNTAGTGVPEALATLPTAAMPALTGDVTTAGGSLATTIANGAVTLAKHANMATARLLGRVTAGSGAPEELTGTQVTAQLDTRTETLKGLMPANMGVRASLAANKSIANTLTQVVGFTAAANTLAVGTTIRFRGLGLLTNTTSASTSVLTLRINSASLGATIEASWSCVLGTTARTNCPFEVCGEIVIISTGGAGTAWGCLVVNCNTATALALPTTMVTAAVTCITNQSNVVEMTCISGASTTTWNFISATVEIVTP